MEIQYFTTITIDEAKKIAQITDQSNELETKSEDHILNHARSLWCVIAKSWDQIIWYIWCTHFDVWEHICIERWSLRVDQWYRRSWISKSLIIQLTTNLSEKPLICLTKETPVHKVCKKTLDRDSYKGKEIQGTVIWEALESWWDLIDKYTIYTNEQAKLVFSTLLHSQKQW